MATEQQFEDIRPYYDEEVPGVIQELLQNESFATLARLFFPDGPEKFNELVRTITSSIEFQGKIIYPTLKQMMDQTVSSLTTSGFDQLDSKASYLFISNHRDIVLDSALLNLLLFEKGFNTTEIAIGNNLLVQPWIADLVRLNKSFIVHRNLPVRQQLEHSQRLSAYIRSTITERNHSVWIAQREGRTKDGDDRTQPSLLKMLNISGEKSLIENMNELRIVPISINYEYDPCAGRKIWELEPAAREITPEEDRLVDLENMITGFKGQKGQVHFAAGNPIVLDGSEWDEEAKRNEQLKRIAACVDQEIFRNYYFFPFNYLAHDHEHQSNRWQDHYTAEDQKRFEDYIAHQVSDSPSLASNLPEKIYRMYAWPIDNHLSQEEA